MHKLNKARRLPVYWIQQCGTVHWFCHWIYLKRILDINNRQNIHRAVHINVYMEPQNPAHCIISRILLVFKLTNNDMQAQKQAIKRRIFKRGNAWISRRTSTRFLTTGERFSSTSECSPAKFCSLFCNSSQRNQVSKRSHVIIIIISHCLSPC